MNIFKVELFNSLEVGDIVWAQMPLPNEVLELVEENQQVRPYLVLRKDNDNIYAFKTSCKKVTEMNNYQSYKINLGEFSSEKNNWIHLTTVKEIPIDNLRHKITHLSHYDLSMIEKLLEIQRNRGKLLDVFLNMPVKICKGDVIQCLTAQKMLHYVYDVEDDKLICYPLSYQYRKHWTKIKINRNPFFVDFNNQIIISDIENVNIFDIANNGEIGLIEKKRRLKKRR